MEGTLAAPCAPSRAGDRAGTVLLGLALLVAAAAGLHDVSAPWEEGLRGEVASTFTSRFVENGLTYGLARTHGLPAYVTFVDGEPTFSFYLRHPPLQYLLMTGAAALFGFTPAVLRLVALVLFLPALPALFLLCRRSLGPWCAGWATLLFATTPLVGYYGPMASHHGLGSLVAAGLWTMVAFDRFLATHSRRAFAATALLFFVTTLLDFLGHLWGIALLVQACAAPRWRAALVAVLELVPVALLSLLLVAVHAGTVLGGTIKYFRQVPSLFAQQHAIEVTGTQVRGIAAVVLFDYGAWMVSALALLGLVWALVVRTPRDLRPVTVAAATAVAGAIACVASLPHLVLHAFWPMPAFPGIAVLAALPAAQCSRSLRQGSVVARLGRLFVVAATALVCVAGCVGTHAQIDRSRLEDPEFPVVVREVDGVTRGCYATLTNRNVPMRHYLPGQLVFGRVHSSRELTEVLHYAPPGSEIAFVLDVATAAPDLVAALRERSPVHRSQHFEVYRFRV